MDDAVAKARRIEIICKDGISDIIRRIEPVKYFSDLEAKGMTFCPESKITFMVSGTRKMVESQFGLLFAYEDMDTDILRLDLHIVERNVLDRKRKYEDCSMDGPWNFGPWDRAEVLRFKEGVNICGWGNWKGELFVLLTDSGVAETVKTRSVESVRTFSRSSEGMQFKPTQIPYQRSAYSDLAETVKHLSRGLRIIDHESGNENGHLGGVLDGSASVAPPRLAYSDLAEAAKHLSRGLRIIDHESGN